jgi:hypothetical protein
MLIFVNYFPVCSEWTESGREREKKAGEQRFLFGKLYTKQNSL